MMAPRAVLPATLPITAPAAAPVAVPMTAPFCVLFIVLQPKERMDMRTKTPSNFFILIILIRMEMFLLIDAFAVCKGDDSSIHKCYTSMELTYIIHTFG